MGTGRVGFLNSREVVPYFKARGFNSSHFVWLIGDFQYFLASSNLVIAFKKRAGILFLALEPLSECLEAETVNQALEELHLHLPYETMVWISIYGEFSNTLRTIGYQSIAIGKEPWLCLKQKVATGKSARGVKSARNQALRAGCKVEEWTSDEIVVDPEKRAHIEKIYEEWRDRRKLYLGAFLNTNDPFSYGSFRRYFLGRDGTSEVKAYLVATQIPATNHYFLEDLVLGEDCSRGMGELLVLTACEKLAQSGIERVSIGVVSGASSGPKRALKNVSFSIRCISSIVERFYNLEGMEVFRKRFQPNEWRTIYMAIKRRDQKSITLWHSLWIFVNLFLVFEPKILGLGWLLSSIRPKRYRQAHGRNAPHSMAKTNSAELGA